jgi:ribosomal protein S18 acetylase RimI-like enzyme
MLRDSTESDLPLVRDLIVEGARSGSFDADLARATREADFFFSRMRRVVLEHVWLRAPGTGGAAATIPANIWIFEEQCVSPAPIGFFAIRGAGLLGYELWLAALHSAYRGRGLGKQMVREVFASPIGEKIVVAQCDLRASGARRMAAILGQMGFRSARRGDASEWLASGGLHPSALAWLKTAPFAAHSDA